MRTGAGSSTGASGMDQAREKELKAPWPEAWRVESSGHPWRDGKCQAIPPKHGYNSLSMVKFPGAKKLVKIWVPFHPHAGRMPRCVSSLGGCLVCCVVWAKVPQKKKASPN